jgi:hypothetical protein
MGSGRCSLGVSAGTKAGNELADTYWSTGDNENHGRQIVGDSL